MTKSAAPTLPSPQRVSGLGALTLLFIFLFGLHILVIEASCRSEGSILGMFGAHRLPNHRVLTPEPFFARRTSDGFRLVSAFDDDWRELYDARHKSLPPECQGIQAWLTRSDQGCWAATSTIINHALSDIGGASAPFPAWIDRDKLRIAVADYCDEREKRWPTGWLAESAVLLRASEGTTTRIRWEGYLHNTLSLLLAGATLWSARRWWIESRLLARHRARPDHCPACRYDLTGLPSRTCPECGMTSPGAPGRSPSAN